MNRTTARDRQGVVVRNNTMFLLLFWALITVGCSGLYELPDPPPRDAWQRHSLSPAEDQDRSRDRFLEAQDSLLGFVEAMSDGRFEEAYALLSNETRILLDDLSPTGRGEHTLETGEIARDSSEYILDPMDLFVVSNLQRIEDTYEDRLEAETYRRKEIYCLGLDETVHHVVMILEEDAWRIHKPEIDLTPGAPGRRALDE